MPADTITPAGAAAPPRPLPCKHILVPGQAHCLTCRAQLLWIEHPRWERLLRSSMNHCRAAASPSPTSLAHE